MRLTCTCSLLASALLWMAALPASASGGDGYQTNRFASEFQPANAELFASGNLGVLPGSYWRVYHYLAYQAARGRPLTKEQVAALDLNTWHVGSASEWAGVDPEKNSADTWLAARAPYAAQAGLAAAIRIDASADTGDSESYLNCHSDAFRQAGATMSARARLGAGAKPDAWFKLWLQGQDAVFANCEEPPHKFGEPLPKRVVKLPPPLPANAPDWLRDDHAYQTAAANFYARNFDLARTQFQAIGRQPKSAWQALAPYLAARTLIRKAMLDYPLREKQPAARERIEALAQARQELDALAKTSAPARHMATLVEARINPAERLAALARALDKEPFGPDTPRMLHDYLVLMDKMMDAQPDSARAAKEAMTVWIASMQAGLGAGDVPGDPGQQARRADVIEILRKSWLKQGDPLWLAPLLAMAHANELTSTERKAAAAVAATHPLYQTLQYHLARLALLEQQAERADKDIDRLLSAYGKQMSVATTNRFLALKMVSAGTVDDFLKAAPRRPDPVERGAAIDAQAKADATETDEDFGIAVSRHLPMAELKILLKHPLLPPAWKSMLQETMFTRALIFNDEETALGLLDAVARTRKSTAHLYERYRKAASGAERKLAGALILVNTPELQPAVVDKNDKARVWGCSGADGQPPAMAHRVMPAPRFLSAQLTAQAAREQETLLRLPLRTEFLAPALLEWARTKPADEEAPKALHFLVGSTRMECPYGRAEPEEKQLRARYSREAYEVAHKLYPASKWTKATKYYY
ncbi:hypothetical protein LXA47_19155 [Massilia sp. P8910]|uniref:hypothetical protein n=1 Tax=Massilia antarctica TaxID=2765360 RepID=UPI001E35430F|nr:hypothetical protein [Massilia antarctica]MCE3605707.1 hypothetical protein [Massilia antarctica]